jgi:hypothetical protein
MINFTSQSPTNSIVEMESEHLLLCFCTYCMLLKGKKLSLQNVFVLVLKEERLRRILKHLLSIDSNFELVKMFLQFEPSIAQSKYITKYLNANKRIDL